MKPRVGISRCLLGDEVRYDGGHKRTTSVIDLGACVEWIPVCPEVEIGMGVPRQPVQLVTRAGGAGSTSQRLRLVGVQTGEDWTERMEAWAAQRVAELGGLGISGFVLKARSPSCGPNQVMVHRGEADPTPTGRGFFADALARAMPDLPIADEERLGDALVRQEFLGRVRTYRPR